MNDLPAFFNCFVIPEGIPLDGTLPETITDKRLQLFRALIAYLAPKLPKGATLTAETRWFVAWKTAAGNENPVILGGIEIFEEPGGKWSFGHIAITTIDPGVAHWFFEQVRSAAKEQGRIMDDLHLDHTRHACRKKAR